MLAARSCIVFPARHRRWLSWQTPIYVLTSAPSPLPLHSPHLTSPYLRPSALSVAAKSINQSINQPIDGSINCATLSAPRSFIPFLLNSPSQKAEKKKPKGDANQAANPKNAEKAAKKAAEKAAKEAKKAANRAAREKAEKEKAAKLAGVGFDTFGKLPVIKSATITDKVWTPIKELNASREGATVTIRGHVLASRPMGKGVFSIVRSALYSVQTVCFESKDAPKVRNLWCSGSRHNIYHVYCRCACTRHGNLTNIFDFAVAVKSCRTCPPFNLKGHGQLHWKCCKRVHS